jgi:ketosteroid isomerase-like protein
MRQHASKKGSEKFVSSSPPQIVRAFYAAVVRRDAQAIADLVESSFREDAAITWPDGLPYGGRVEGARRLTRLFAGMATSVVPIGPDRLEVEAIIDGGDQVVARLGFQYRAPGSADSIPSSALELWTFKDGLVAEIRAYYWDTAACRDLSTHNNAASADA